MFDTMTMTKAVGAFCACFLVFLLGKWAAEALYHTGGGHGGSEQAYVIDTGADDGDGEEELGVDFAELLAIADPGKGERVFNKCSACHKLEDGANGVGPHLYDVVDRPVAEIDGFSYSGALVAVADVWDADHLNGFLENPKSYAPGTKMSFNGLPKAEDRANLIAYLDTVGN